MSKESLRHRLLQLASAQDRQKLAQIREVFDEIEIALNAGATRAQVVQALHAEGINVTPQVFTNYVSKLRRERALEEQRRIEQGLPPLAPLGTRPEIPEGDESDDTLDENLTTPINTKTKAAR